MQGALRDMMQKYVLGIDQSTQGTKAILFDCEGRIIARADVPHNQLETSEGWVEHNPEEIIKKTIEAAGNAIKGAKVDSELIGCVGNKQPAETCVAWDRQTGEPVYNAIVWQCGRAQQICEEMRQLSDLIKKQYRDNAFPVLFRV
jgi:glycerol kinase